MRAPLTTLRADLADMRRSAGGMLFPKVPQTERTRVRRLIETVFRSERTQRARGALADARARLRGEVDPEAPPHRLALFVGGGDYHGIGQEFKRLFVELGGLEPHHDVLDVGCGCGRMAKPLTGWLSGRYEGIDVYPEAVEWCRRNITPGHPSFRFQVADIASARYNPAGTQSPESYRLPYDDASFDFALLTSVFTHLETAAVDNYLGELARVLRPGGRLFATYFLMNDEALELMDGTGAFGFERGDALLVDEDVPERAVAFREQAVRDLHERHGLPIESTHYGSWCGRPRYTSFQDITVSVRR